MTWSKAVCKFCGTVVAEREEPVQHFARTLVLIEDLRCLSCAAAASTAAARRAEDAGYRNDFEAELKKYIDVLGPGSMVYWGTWGGVQLYHPNGVPIKPEDEDRTIHVEIESTFGIPAGDDEIDCISYSRAIDLGKCDSPAEEARLTAIGWNAELKRGLEEYARLSTFDVGGEQ